MMRDDYDSTVGDNGPSRPVGPNRSTEVRRAKEAGRKSRDLPAEASPAGKAKGGGQGGPGAGQETAGNGPGVPLHASVLVLNRYYLAIQVISARRAFGLLCKDAAEVICHHNDYASNLNFGQWVAYSMNGGGSKCSHDDFVHTPRLKIIVPRIIRLLEYAKLPHRDVKFTRRNILARDGHRCQYCGKRFSPSTLSIDHVVPKARGGKATWANVVAACPACNARKGSKTPVEANMHLVKLPAPPRRNPILLSRARSERYLVWKPFLDQSLCTVEME